MEDYTNAKKTRQKLYQVVTSCKQVVTSLFKSCRKVLHGRVSCFKLSEQVWNKLLRTRRKLDETYQTCCKAACSNKIDMTMPLHSLEMSTL